MEGDRFTQHAQAERAISIHALRVEGDVNGKLEPIEAQISIHALRVEGDSFASAASPWRAGFLSTPSGWRATQRFREVLDAIAISIHALRVEGDSTGKYQNNKIGYFYPRPPGGGRQRSSAFAISLSHFYPRPPGGGRLAVAIRAVPDFVISIHALRVEGDWMSLLRAWKP